MKRLSKIYALSLLALLSVTACVEDFNADLPSDTVGMLVVSGDIISDTTCVFAVSRTYSLNEEEVPTDISKIDAQVKVVGSDGSSWQAVAQGNGKFEAVLGTLNPEVEYHLEVAYDGETYTSTAQRPLVTEPIDSLSYKQAVEYGPVNIYLSVTGDEDAYYVWNFEEVWELRSYMTATSYFDVAARKVKPGAGYARSLGWSCSVSSSTLVGTVINNEGHALINKPVYSIQANDYRLSVLYSTNFIQRRVSKAEYEYYSEKAKISEGSGGLFGTQPSELPTNITCTNSAKKAIGYVGVNMNVSTKRLFIDNKDIKFRETLNCPVVFASDFTPPKSEEEMYNSGYWAIEGTGVSTTWTYERCVNVRALGATIFSRPSYWPIKK